jgi:lysophospholipase L1-like esterase
MDIVSFNSGVTVNIRNKTAEHSISPIDVGDAFINLANITKANVESGDTRTAALNAVVTGQTVSISANTNSINSLTTGLTFANASISANTVSINNLNSTVAGINISSTLNFKVNTVSAYVGFPYTGGTVSINSDNLLIASASTPSKYYAAVTTGQTSSAIITGFNTYVVVGANATKTFFLNIIAGSGQVNTLYTINADGTFSLVGIVSGITNGISNTSKVKIQFNSAKVQVYYTSSTGSTYTLYGEIDKATYGITSNKVGTINNQTITENINIVTVLDDGTPKSELNPDSINTITSIDTANNYVLITDPTSASKLSKVVASRFINPTALNFAADRTAAFAIVNNPGSNYTTSYNSTSHLLTVRPVTIGSAGVYCATLSDAELVETVLDYTLYGKSWAVIGANGSNEAFMINVENASGTLYKVLANGGLQGLGNFTTPNASALTGTKIKVKWTDATVDIYDYVSNAWVLWRSISRAAVGITKSLGGAVSSASGQVSGQFDVYTYPVYKSTGTDITLNTDTISTTPAFNLLMDKFLITTQDTTSHLKQIDLAALSAVLGVTRKWVGKSIYLYGDSISSTDYSWYGTYLASKTGANVTVGGKSGRNVAQLTDLTFLNVVTAATPDLIIFLPGGNDAGTQGTIGTFNPLVTGSTGEILVSDPIVTTAYSGNTYIEAIAYTMRYLNKALNDFRTGVTSYNAVTTNPYPAGRKTKIIALGGLPQKRYDNTLTQPFNNPLNHKRKSDAVLECCNRYHIPFLNSLQMCGWNMDLEPFWPSPTDMVNSYGIYTMDGLHPNRYGYDRLTDVITDFINGI